MATRGYIDVRIYGSEKAVIQMLRLVETSMSFSGMSVFLSGVVDPYLRRRAKGRFALEGDDASGKWAPLRESTVFIRQAKGFPGRHPINRRTGQLERYITEGKGKIGQEAVFTTLTIPGNAATGELKAKVRTAQTGKSSSKVRSTVPRPVLTMNERDLLFVTAELAFFIQRGGRL